MNEDYDYTLVVKLRSFDMRHTVEVPLVLGDDAKAQFEIHIGKDEIYVIASK